MTPAFGALPAPASWHAVDIVSDLHLHPGTPATVDAWTRYLAATPAQALFILGDWFEAWVGDDAAQQPGLEADCAAAMRQAARRLDLFVMHGNRDFLLGPAYAAQCGARLLADPTVLTFGGQRWLLTHGDALCLADTGYLAFRAQVRSAAWQCDFLARPLLERRAIARSLRDTSQARKHGASDPWADVDAAAAAGWLRAAQAATLIHGHTHRPGGHALGAGLTRIALSDWDAAARPPRAQVLRLTQGSAPQRIPST